MLSAISAILQLRFPASVKEDTMSTTAPAKRPWLAPDLALEGSNKAWALHISVDRNGTPIFWLESPNDREYPKYGGKGDVEVAPERIVKWCEDLLDQFADDRIRLGIEAVLR